MIATSQELEEDLRLLTRWLVLAVSVGWLVRREGDTVVCQKLVTQ